MMDAEVQAQPHTIQFLFKNTIVNNLLISLYIQRFTEENYILGGGGIMVLALVRKDMHNCLCIQRKKNPHRLS